MSITATLDLAKAFGGYSFRDLGIKTFRTAKYTFDKFLRARTMYRSFLIVFVSSRLDIYYDQLTVY